MAGKNGAAGVEDAASWPRIFFRPREVSGKGLMGRGSPGNFGLGGRMTRGVAGEARFGVALLDATWGKGIGADRGFCDCGGTAAGVTVTGLADEDGGIIAGTCASVFSVDGDDDLFADTTGGTFESEGASGDGKGVDDGLIADGVAGCASREIANGEI